MWWFSGPRAPAADSIEAGWSTLTVVNEWIKHGDAKIGVTLAFMGALAGGLVTLVAEHGVRGVVGAWALGLAAALVAGSFALGVVGLKARSEHSAASANLLYFGDVARCYGGRAKAAEQFVADWKMFTDGRRERLVEALARQIHANSIIADRKFHWANRSMLFATAAVAVSAVATVLVVARV